MSKAWVRGLDAEGRVRRFGGNNLFAQLTRERAPPHVHSEIRPRRRNRRAQGLKPDRTRLGWGCLLCRRRARSKLVAAPIRPSTSAPRSWSALLALCGNRLTTRPGRRRQFHTGQTCHRRGGLPAQLIVEGDSDPGREDFAAQHGEDLIRPCRVDSCGVARKTSLPGFVLSSCRRVLHFVCAAGCKFVPRERIPAFRNEPPDFVVVHPRV